MTTKNPVELVPYDPDWPLAFERIRFELAELLKPHVVAIDHIGSTSVLGLAAKPLIDIDMTLYSLDHITPATEILVGHGYEARGNRYDDDVWAFMLRHGTPPQRVYILPPCNETHRKRMIFRDHLRAHPETAAAYAALKQKLAAKFRDDGDRYTASKAEFVNAVLAQASRLE
ncbi:MAG: GrpB family protein [Rhizobiaceae bacterium]|nr:GrpB family protein [Rhizobiaceae bacterium]